jgi:hypothetical protein
MVPVGDPDLVAMIPCHHRVMPLVGFSDVQIESIGKTLTAPNDDLCTAVRDILHVTFDRGEIRIDQNLPSEEYARSRGDPLLSKIGLHVASLNSDTFKNIRGEHNRQSNLT